MPKGQIETEFEYITASGDSETVLFNFEFSYSAGTRRSHPGGHYDRATGSWDPPDDPEWEMGEVSRRDADGKWVPVAEADWFWQAWVLPKWETFDMVDFEQALGES